ncbi:MAG: hypothetical protein LBB61_02270 [Treponema sp.]|jgi:hypothetical protein|nr:hypothetical protein [Treponema sp.]
MKNNVLLYSLFFLLFLFLAACTRTEPELSYAVMQLVYVQESGVVKERFSFFVIANDEDGIENLADLYLYHDHEGLRWHISERDWLSVQQDNNTWLGSRSIAMIDDEPLPRGLYRAVLVNKAGEEAARTIAFDPPVLPRFPFPSLAVADGTYTIESQYPVNYLLGYDEQGNYVQTVRLPTLQGTVADAKFNAKVKSAALWAEDQLYATSALTDAQLVQ